MNSASKGNTQLVEALRDFFAADNALAMEKAYLALDRENFLPLPTVREWNKAEFSFNRLFTGPQALEAPPYASVYLQPEPLLMAETTMTVRKVYESMGLASCWKNTVPDDHISIELDAARILLQLKHQPDREESDELRKFFVQEHMGTWIPAFCSRVENSGHAHEAIVGVCRILAIWLKQQIREIQDVSGN
ncbi:MAG: TorD/DmsD family molecular chaperone [Desulfonatronovibrionaceae bacterium]